MMSLSDTSLVEKEGAYVNGADQDGAEQKGGAANLDYLNLNRAALCLTVVASMAHMTWKGSNMEKGTEKWRKILVIAKENMSLSQDIESW